MAKPPSRCFLRTGWQRRLRSVYILFQWAWWVLFIQATSYRSALFSGNHQMMVLLLTWPNYVGMELTIRTVKYVPVTYYRQRKVVGKSELKKYSFTITVLSRHVKIISIFCSELLAVLRTYHQGCAFYTCNIQVDNTYFTKF